MANEFRAPLVDTFDMAAVQDLIGHLRSVPGAITHNEARVIVANMISYGVGLYNRFAGDGGLIMSETPMPEGAKKMDLPTLLEAVVAEHQAKPEGAFGDHVGMPWWLPLAISLATKWLEKWLNK